jgi:hypothetical protein
MFCSGEHPLSKPEGKEVRSIHAMFNSVAAVLVFLTISSPLQCCTLVYSIKCRFRSTVQPGKWFVNESSVESRSNTNYCANLFTATYIYCIILHLVLGAL